MPKPPRFQSAQTQAIAVTLAMTVLLVGSIGVAYAFTLSEATPGVSRVASTTEQRVHRFEGGLTLELSDRWSAIKGDVSPDGMTRIALFRHSDTANLRLMVAKATTPNPQPMKGVLLGTLDELVQGPSQSLAPPVVSQSNGRSSGQYIGLSDMPQANAIRQHLLYIFTRDDQTFWVLYMTDLGPTSESPRPRIRRNAELFKQIRQSMSFEPADSPSDLNAQSGSARNDLPSISDETASAP